MLNTRKACLGGHPCEAETLKEVLHCATHHLPSKSFEQVADEVGMKVSTLSDMTNPGEPDFPPMRILPGLLAATKERPILAKYFARLQSGLFVTMPAGVDGVENELFASATELLKQLSEALGKALRGAERDNAATPPMKVASGGRR